MKAFGAVEHEKLPASGQFEVQNRQPWEDGVALRLL